MPRRRRAQVDTRLQIDLIKASLDEFASAANLPVREQVRRLVPVFRALRDLGCSLSEADEDAGRERIIDYFKRHPMTLIDGDELFIVSGIGEWARRVRELRVQYGWSICSGMTFREMAEADPEAAAEIGLALGADPSRIRPDQYVLTSLEQDTDAAERWAQLNTIRKGPGGVKAKLLSYFRKNVGRAVPLEELRYLAGDRSEWARRVRELRTEDGWPIFTRVQGRPDLKVGSYVLEEDRQAVEHDRRIPDDIRIAVLVRDNFACTCCGWTRDDKHPDDPRRLLELHHLVAHRLRGANTVENLITLCNVHHDQVHAGRLVRNYGRWTAP